MLWVSYCDHTTPGVHVGHPAISTAIGRSHFLTTSETTGLFSLKLVKIIIEQGERKIV